MLNEDVIDENLIKLNNIVKCIDLKFLEGIKIYRIRSLNSLKI